MTKVNDQIILQDVFYLCIPGILPIVFRQYPLISISACTPVPIVLGTFAYIFLSCETYILSRVHFLKLNPRSVVLNMEACESMRPLQRPLAVDMT